MVLAVLVLIYQNLLLITCSYMREKESEEELMQQRREEEGKGKERRKALLEKEERRRHETEASVISAVPDVGTKEAAAMAAAMRAMGGDVLLDESCPGDQVSSLARRILIAQRAQRAQQVHMIWSLQHPSDIKDPLNVHKWYLTLVGCGCRVEFKAQCV
jgi:hypothetical protein